MDTLIVILDFLSRAIAIVLAIGGALAFVFQSIVKGWIDAYFKRRVETQLADKNHALSISLEEKKAALTKELTTEGEALKSRLMKDLEKHKRDLDEAYRRRQIIEQRSLQYFDDFSTGYGTIFVELYALQGNYFKPLESVSVEFVQELRSAMVLKIHQMLVQAQSKLGPSASYIPVELASREARLFADLSTFLSEGANDQTRLNELATEKSMIWAELHTRLFGKVEAIEESQVIS